MKPERVQPPNRATVGGGAVSIVETKHRFTTPAQAFAFVSALGTVAQRRNRYPTILIDLNEVTLRLAAARKSDLTQMENRAADMVALGS